MFLQTPSSEAGYGGGGNRTRDTFRNGSSVEPNSASYSFVYFIQQGADGPVKIGIAANPEKRLRQLQSGNPDRLYVRAIVRTAEPDRLEKDLHGRFGQHRMGGEWFHPTADLMAYMDEHGESQEQLAEAARVQRELEEAAGHREALAAMDRFLAMQGVVSPTRV